MSLILNIDTAVETAGVSIAKDGIILQGQTNHIQKDHAVFLHRAIQETVTKASVAITSLDAVAVTQGPGSYTGLRVGMATAKGLCYALQKPLITVGSLPVIAHAAIQAINDPNVFYCPMIDARRLEVYTAIYDHNLQTVLPAAAVILNDKSFGEILIEKKIVFFGNGSLKWKQINVSVNAGFIDQMNVTGSLARLSFDQYISGVFADLVYAEPLYIKEFFSP